MLSFYSTNLLEFFTLNMKWLKFFETSENIHARSQLHFQKTWALNDTAVSTSDPYEVLKLLLLKTVVVCPWISKYPFVRRRSLHSTVTGSHVHERYNVWTRCIACLRKTGCCYLHFRCHVLTTRTPCLSPQDGQITPADSDRHTNVRCCPLRCVQWEMPRLLAHARTHIHTAMLPLCIVVKPDTSCDAKNLCWRCSRKKFGPER